MFLDDYRLPPLERWYEQFDAIVGGRYILREIEVTLTGTLEHRNGQSLLAATEHRPEVFLEHLRPTSKVQLDTAVSDD